MARRRARGPAARPRRRRSAGSPARRCGRHARSPRRARARRRGGGRAATSAWPSRRCPGTPRACASPPWDRRSRCSPDRSRRSRVDVVLMAQTEVGEVAEPAGAGRGGSSTMPHKQNPVGSILTLACARRAQAAADLLTGSLVQEHERAAGAWQSEWDAISERARGGRRRGREHGRGAHRPHGRSLADGSQPRALARARPLGAPRLRARRADRPGRREDGSSAQRERAPRSGARRCARNSRRPGTCR